jgi:hypothetical protein
MHALKTLATVAVSAAGAALLAASPAAADELAGSDGVIPEPRGVTCVAPIASRPSVACTQAATLWFNSKSLGLGSGTMFRTVTAVGRQVTPLAYSNLAGYRFLGNGAGKGQGVKNNAAAGTNNNGRVVVVNVWYEFGFSGPVDTINPAITKNLTVTKNENASLNVGYRV